MSIIWITVELDGSSDTKKLMSRSSSLCIKTINEFEGELKT
jgi:hypothetical protein